MALSSSPRTAVSRLARRMRMALIWQGPRKRTLPTTPLNSNAASPELMTSSTLLETNWPRAPSTQNSRKSSSASRMSSGVRSTLIGGRPQRRVAEWLDVVSQMDAAENLAADRDAIGFGHVVSRKSERSAVAAHARVHHPACLTIWIRNYQHRWSSCYVVAQHNRVQSVAIVRSHPIFCSVVVNKCAAMGSCASKRACRWRPEGALEGIWMNHRSTPV